MNSKKMKNKIYTNFLLTVVIFGIIYFFIYPLYAGGGAIYHPEKSLSQMLEEKRNYTSAINIAEGYLAKISKTSNDYFNALNSLPIDTLNRVLPTNADPVYVVYEISKIASLPESGMIIQNPKVIDDGQDKNTNKKFNTLSVSFTVEGSYQNLKSFLSNLEKSERVYNITGLSFSTAQDTGANTPIKYNLVVDTYYIKNK